MSKKIKFSVNFEITSKDFKYKNDFIDSLNLSVKRVIEDHFDNDCDNTYMTIEEENSDKSACKHIFE